MTNKGIEKKIKNKNIRIEKEIRKDYEDERIDKERKKREINGAKEMILKERKRETVMKRKV